MIKYVLPYITIHQHISVASANIIRYYKWIQKIIYINCADIECCKPVFLFHWRLYTAEMLQLELTNGTFVIQGKIFTVISPGSSFHRVSSIRCTLETGNLLSTCMLWSVRQLAATSSVTKQAKRTVCNSTKRNAKKNAGNFKLLHIDSLFSVITAIWHTYQ